jgi:sugar phosphate isomerase/epimerase
MNISTSLNVFHTKYSTESSAAKCKAAGFDSLDFNYWDHQKYVAGISAEEERDWARSIREAADKQGIGFSQMHGPVHGRTFADLVPGLTVESFLTMAERSLETAATLGVPWVVFHPTSISTEPQPYEKVLSYNISFYRKLLPAMERTGVGIALENSYDRIELQKGGGKWKYFVNAGELVDLIDALNHPLFGACWDTGHANEQGLKQQAMIELGSRLKATHINDNDGIRDQHLLPFQGNIYWTAVIQSLKEIGFAGAFTYESHSSIRHLPEPLQQSGLKYAADVARYLTSLAGAEQ